MFDAKLAGERVRLMIDSGANQNYVSTQIAEKLKVYRETRPVPYPLTMADGSTTGWVRERLHQIQLTIGKHNEKISLDITALPKYDVVLGIVWLHDYNPKIDWK